MKPKIYAALLAFMTTWALVVTFLYWTLKNNPRVVAVTTEAGKLALPQEQWGEMERVTFLRQYLERYFNYDSNNFWQSQTSLAFLMAPKLSEERVREVHRLKEKIQQKNLSQKGQLLSLQQAKDGSYEVREYLQIKEDSSQGKPESLYLSLKLRLQNTERTLENPWGLLVKNMDFQSSSTNPFEFSSAVHLQKETPALITFPCALENVTNPNEELLKTKITTLNVSELQLSSQSGLTSAVTLAASCKEREFQLQVFPAADEKDLYRILSYEQGTVRKKDAGKNRSKDIYEKTIEKVLGIELEK